MAAKNPKNAKTWNIINAACSAIYKLLNDVFRILECHNRHLKNSDRPRKEERKVLTLWNFGTRSTCVVRNTITPITVPTTRNIGITGTLPKDVCQTVIKQLKWNGSWVVLTVMPSIWYRYDDYALLNWLLVWISHLPLFCSRRRHGEYFCNIAGNYSREKNAKEISKSNK